MMATPKLGVPYYISFFFGGVAFAIAPPGEAWIPLLVTVALAAAAGWMERRDA
jgi:hypothetical protein